MQDHGSSGNGSFFPWCSTAFASLCVATSLWAAGGTAPVAAEAETQLAQLEQTIQRHPYLEAGPLLVQRLGADALARAQAEHAEALAARGSPPIPPRLVQREQAELDALQDEVRATLDRLPARRLGVDPAAWPSTRLLSHTPIHAGFAHLLGNVVLLLFLGLYLESAWGRARYLTIGALAAVGAGLGFSFAAPETLRPLAGTSGLLAGLLPLFALHYAKARGDGFYWVGLVLGTLWLVLPPLAGWHWSVDAPGAALLSNTAPPALATFGAYAGAALAALTAYQVMRLTGLPDYVPDADADAKPTSSAPDAGRIARLRGKRQLEDAFVQANAWARREPDSLDAVLTLRELAVDLKRPAVARTALLRAVRLELQAGLMAAAVDHWLELTSSGVPKEAEPALLIRLAGLLAESSDRESAARALRAALEHAGDANRAVVGARVARAARDLDPQLAHDAAWRALQSPELALKERQSLEELLAVVVPRMPSHEIEPPAVTGTGRPVPIEIETRVRVLDAIDAVPVELDADGVQIATASGQKKLVRYDRIEAVSVAAIQGLGPKPVLIVDLVLDWKAAAGARLRVIRLRADKFDPRRVLPGVASPVDALRQMVATILTRSRGVPLPDAEAARGMPFASFDALSLYQRLVLMAEGPAQAEPAGRASAPPAAPPPAPAPAAAPPEQWELER
jgi:membrane associated rhomboid family serine protease